MMNQKEEEKWLKILWKDILITMNDGQLISQYVTFQRFIPFHYLNSSIFEISVVWTFDLLRNYRLLTLINT